jgi:hypothetical protein
MRKLAAALIVLAACGDDWPAEPFGRCDQLIRAFPVRLRARIDVLLLVANAPSLSDEQEALAAESGWLIDRMAASPLGFLPDLHVGVMSDDRPGLIVPEECAPLSDGALFIVDELADETTGARTVNHTPSLDVQLACMIRVGLGGGDVVRPLASLASTVVPRATCRIPPASRSSRTTAGRPAPAGTSVWWSIAAGRRRASGRCRSPPAAFRPPVRDARPDPPARP